MTDFPLLRVEDLRVDITTGRGILRAVRGLSLEVKAGETFRLVGESGCGKSTLGRIVTGLMSPSDGATRFRGQDITSIDRRELARLVQPIFRDPSSSLNPRRSIAATVAGLRVPPALPHRRADLLDTCSLAGAGQWRRGRLPSRRSDISGGSRPCRVKKPSPTLSRPSMKGVSRMISRGVSPCRRKARCRTMMRLCAPTC